MIMKTLRQFSTCVNVSSSPVHHKHTEIGQPAVSSQLLPSFSTDSFLRGTIRRVTHSVIRRIKKDRCGETNHKHVPLMVYFRKFVSMEKYLFTILFSLCLLFAFAPLTQAQLPEGDQPETNGASVLIFPYYHASFDITQEDTTLSILNVGDSAVYIKVFLRPQSQSIYASLEKKYYITSGNTLKLEMSVVDPGYIASAYAIVVDSQDVPIKSNSLVGVANIIAVSERTSRLYII